MDFERGYRLKVSGVAELCKLLAAYRTHSLRLMASALAEQTARRAVLSLDARDLGLSAAEGDLVARAASDIRAAHAKAEGPLFAPDLNCRMEFHFVGQAVLAAMTHGSDRYRKPWEARREVVRWGWSETMQRPSNVGEPAWADRARYWREAGKASGTGYGLFSFVLLDGRLPDLGWNAVGRSLPDFEWRVSQAVRRLAMAEKLDPAALRDRDRSRLEDRVRTSLRPTLDEASFAGPARAARARESRGGAGTQRRGQAPPSNKDGRQPGSGAAIVDHADLVIASDGRPFLAVPHVGFRAEDRVFVQVGSKDITFSQNGIQYGTVRNVPAASRDFLKTLTSVTLVEVAEADGKRLLRAKHTAMVSDISLGEGLRRPLQTFRRRPRGAGMEEI